MESWLDLSPEKLDRSYSLLCKGHVDSCLERVGLTTRKENKPWNLAYFQTTRLCFHHVYMARMFLVWCMPTLPLHGVVSVVVNWGNLTIQYKS